MLACFKQSGNPLLVKDLFIHCFKISKVRSHSLKIFVGISPHADLQFFKSFIIFLTSSLETGLNENVLETLKFCLIICILGCFSYD